jgi:hypothetical protein
MTHAARDGDMQAALAKIDALPCTSGKTIRMRVEYYGHRHSSSCILRIFGLKLWYESQTIAGAVSIEK